MSVTCLVADDSLFARMLVKDAVGHVFKDAQYIEAASGEETLAKHAENGDSIDWYLLDINMGSPDGVKTAAALIERGINQSSIALITGNKSVELQAQAEEMGVRYINKAISPTDVEGFIARLKEFFNA